jgi:hypothetical protein
VIVPIYPNEGDRYNEIVDEDVQIYVIENVYKITGNREYYINPIEY